MAFPIGLTVLVILGVVGCQITPLEIIQKDPYPISSNLEIQIRRAAMNASSAETARLFSSAARLLSTHNGTQQTKSIIARVKNDPALFSRLSRSDRFEVELIDLELKYLSTNPLYKNDLIKQLEILTPTTLVQEISALELAAQIRISMVDHVGAVRTLVRLSTYPGVDEKQLAERIWSSIKKIPLGYSATLARNADTEDEFAWWDLATKFLSPLTPTLQQRGWDVWRSANPTHLANKQPPSETSNRPDEPRTIALLLPQNGPLAEASRAIRDGFVAAYWSTQLTDEFEAHRQQKILVYDTFGNTMADVVSRAQADGAQILLGPLSKSNVQSMGTLKTAIPTIALNRVNPTLQPKRTEARGPNGRIPQLSLAVEDEAVELAKRISNEGSTRIIVFRDRTSWSNRAYAAFAASISNSVEIVSLTTFDDLKDVTNAVGRALDIDASLMRHTNVQRLVRREIEFVPRRRSDIHAVVGLVGSREYASLVAALDFHFGSDIPLFATSAAVRSDVPIKKKNGTRFVALPLTLFSFRLRHDLENAFPVAKQNPSFYALGIDAYRLANQFERLMAGVSIPATTGNLKLSRNNLIQRVPAWGQITNNSRIARPLSIVD
ncbi:MAG: penicillin-binding protein activator [Pseudomonadota bacterium]|nr:penicillin-binding protein activator [Pseudomonadota bacterium]